MSDFKGTRDFVACNHLRSYKYYADSILNPDGFAGFPCASYTAFSEVSTLCFSPEEFCDHHFSSLSECYYMTDNLIYAFNHMWIYSNSDKARENFRELDL